MVNPEPFFNEVILYKTYTNCHIQLTLSSFQSFKQLPNKPKKSFVRACNIRRREKSKVRCCKVRQDTPSAVERKAQMENSIQSSGLVLSLSNIVHFSPWILVNTPENTNAHLESFCVLCTVHSEELLIIMLCQRYSFLVHINILKGRSNVLVKVWWIGLGYEICAFK